jgi:hypothetical protein
MGDLPRLTLEPDDICALRAELEGNLRLGGAFVAGEPTLPERSRCELVLVHPETRRELPLVAEVVFVKSGGADEGTGLQLLGFDDELLKRLEAFAAKSAAKEPAKPLNVNERVRSLSSTEQQKLARSGGYAERLALERALGKAIWESLLQNPRLTHPEVAKIARMGTLPGPQVEAIATNPSWLGASAVRRALLANPRLTGPLVERVLRALPRTELKQLPRQSGYPATVRSAAQQLLAKSSR